jgi:hypothetical protein
MTRIALLGLALALTSAPACGVTSAAPGNPTGPSDPSGDPSGGGTISPRSGSWAYGEVTPVSNTCSMNTPRGQNGDFLIDQVSASSFRIIPADSTAPFTCRTTGAKFSCPNRASFVMDVPGVNATITVHATASGTFSDTTHATGSQQATVDCAGAQCALVGPLPCTFAVNFEIHAEG